MSKRAVLYRMVMDKHVCPFGIKSRDLLEREGYSIDDRHLTSREETDAFKEKHQVDTTPQTFINDERIGGYDDLRDYFGKEQEGQRSSSYTPVIMIFSLAALMVVALLTSGRLNAAPAPVIMHFVAFSMIMLALQKLQDLTAFSNMFITYDLLARRQVRYAYVYPFAEAYAGIGMLALLPALWVAPVSLFIGTVGAISVIKAVYIDKRDLKCACVGGDSDVPLGFISLTENLFMAGAGIWMLYRDYMLLG